jgi:hypothetical protein
MAYDAQGMSLALPVINLGGGRKGIRLPVVEVELFIQEK